jgi:Transposase IS66 family
VTTSERDLFSLRFTGAAGPHARRKFYEVQQATGLPIATEALRRIAELYAIEAAIRGQTATFAKPCETPGHCR